MNANITRHTCICFLSVICIGSTLSLQTHLVYSDAQPQKKAAVDIAKKTENPDPKQAQKPKEDLKQWARKHKLPVEPIIEEMKRAGKLIENQQTGQETQKLQKQVVQNLEELIRLLESAPKTSSQRPSQNNKQPQPGDDQKSQQQKGGAGQQNAQQASQGPARQSSERKEDGLVTSGSLPDRNAYIKDAWGHLPPAMRQQLLNIYTEKFLPQYEDQVRRYYEALAEKKKRTP